MVSRRGFWRSGTVILATVVAVGGVIAFGVLDTGDKIASVVSGVIGLATLVITRLNSRRPIPVDEALEAAYLRGLAVAEAERLQWEASTRGLVFPEPLRVPWSSIGGPFVASPDVVLGRLPGVRRTALRLRGDVTTLADTVAALPARQVVITGAPGSGKTSAAILLAQRIAQDGTAPVLLDLVAWDPDSWSLDDWIAGQLTVSSASSRVEEARAIASRLVARGAVVPVLDGFDELSDRLREEVIRTVHDWARPFVLTSRAHEYETAVRNTGRTVAKALVVRLGPLPITEITAHLTAGRADADRRWAPVTSRLTGPGPLYAVLSSPLMSSIAKKAYDVASADPAELVTFGDVEDLEFHLLERAYPRDGTFAWLTALAHILDRHEIRHLDLCGPLIPVHWPRWRRRVLSVSVILCYVVLIGVLARIEWTGALIDKLTLLVFWVALVTAFLVLRLATRSGIHAALLFRLSARPRKILRGAAAFTLCTTIFTVFSVNSARSAPLDARVVVIGTAGVALLAALVGAVTWGSLTEPTVGNDRANPLSAIRSDGWALVSHFPAPILGMAIYCAFAGELSTLPQSTALVFVASTAILNQIPGAAWSRWGSR